MTVDNSIDLSIQVNAKSAGQSPARDGYLNFGASQNKIFPQTATMACIDIQFADLVLSGGNYVYKIITETGNKLKRDSDNAVITDLVGNEIVVPLTSGFAKWTFFFFQTNTNGTFTDHSVLPSPGSITANGMVLLNLNHLTAYPEDADEPIFTVTFSAGSIAATGAANFRAQLIFTFGPV